MRVVSAYLQGIAQAAEAGFFDWAIEQDVDVICLQDIRAYEYELDAPCYNPPGYQRYFFEAWEPGQGGVAIFTRHQPKAMISGLGFPLADQGGRYIQLDYDKLSIACVLAPAPLEGRETVKDSEEFYTAFVNHLYKQSRKRREFILCGGWNVACNKIDVSDWREQQDYSGFLVHEQRHMQNIMGDLGYVDAFREVDREAGHYTRHDEEFSWRFDYQLVTPGMRHTVLNAGIYTAKEFSDHAPVIVDYEWELSI